MRSGKALYFVQVPPPVHGVSLMNKVITESSIVSDVVRGDVLPINFSKSNSDVNRVGLHKLIKMFRLVLQLFCRLVFFRPDFMYFTLTPTGVGFLRDCMYVLVAKALRVKIVLHLHGVGIAADMKGVKKYIYRFVFNNSYVIHLSKNLLQAEVLDNFSEIIRRGFVVENGVDIGRASGPLSNKSNRILYVSNLFPGKGVTDLLWVFGELYKEDPSLHLDIVGASSGNDILNRMMSIVDELDMSKNVHIHGFLEGEDKAEKFANAKILLHPTRNDAFPLVLLEAMSYGLPIVSTKVGAIPEIVRHCDTGYICSPGDIPELVQSTRTLLQNDELRRRISERSLKEYHSRFSVKAFEKRIAEVFAEVIL